MSPLGKWLGALLYGAARAFHVFFGVGPCCRFQPTCSQFAREAVGRHGLFRGGYLAAGRILRCRPGGGHGWDPV